ncbi:MAG TPA: hypothetical protein VGO60_00820, partial [Iamia sp.]|nr:hypothetical protein [Iamia sp.]
LIEYAIAHGDALAAAGRADEADDAYGLVAGIAALQEANGVQIDVDLALFDAEHDPGDEAVAQARRGLEQRPSIIGHDALAWNLFRAGSIDEARDEAERALVTGSEDPAIRFHAAAIAHAAGDDEAARQHLAIVLGGNPRFSAALVDDVVALTSDLGLVMPPAAAAT